MHKGKGKRGSKVPELRVVFDTNVLWTGSASDLLKQEVLELIQSNSKHADLLISWYLPDIVRHERQFQMLRQSLELLPSIQKLERLLGHNLNITEEIIQQRVQGAVESHIQSSGLQSLKLDHTNVDWDSIILNSAYRRPPFAPGEKEKGFRDAIVAEEFLQLVAESPKTPKICRIALITGDTLLADAVKSRTANSTNVRILLTLEELKGLINTLVAEVSEEFIAKVLEKAKEYFFEVEQTDTLYYKEKVRGRITEKFSSELRRIPEGADVRESGTWYIQPPRFVKKSGQRVYWASRINIEAKAYKYIASEAMTGSYLSSTPIAALTEFDVGKSIINYQSGSFLGSTPYVKIGQPEYDVFSFKPTKNTWTGPLSTQTKSLAKTGKSTFEITWSVAVTTTGKFSSPRVESVNYIETLWE